MAMGEVCSRKARTASPSSFLRGFAARGGGSATHTPMDRRLPRPQGEEVSRRL
jgi:hypothetical protein